MTAPRRRGIAVAPRLSCGTCCTSRGLWSRSVIAAGAPARPGWFGTDRRGSGPVHDDLERPLVPQEAVVGDLPAVGAGVGEQEPVAHGDRLDPLPGVEDVAWRAQLAAHAHLHVVEAGPG